jgi:ATP-dependent DNA ligase
VTTWHIELESDPNDSSSGSTYTYGVTADGRLQCNCRGWATLKKVPGYRWCKHTKDLISTYHFAVEQRGDYQYVKDAPGPAPGPAGWEPTPGGWEAPDKPVPAPAPHVVTIGNRRIKTVGTASPAPAVKKTERDILQPFTSVVPKDVYVKPMLASPMPNLPDQRVATLLSALSRYPASDWVLEEKFDGHRVTVAVGDFGVCAWSRPRAGKEALVRTLPPHISAAFGHFPAGTYDGELFIPGAVSTSVTDLKNAGKEVFVVFDITRLLGNDVCAAPWDERRQYLEQMFRRDHIIAATPSIQLSQVFEPHPDMVRRIWAQGGEGAILKRRRAAYRPGARSADIIKIKSLETDVLVVTGFEAGKLGSHSVLLLRNPKDGSTTSIASMGGGGAMVKAIHANPQKFLGRPVRIEYQLRTADGGYRHPRFDRWEDE